MNARYRTLTSLAVFSLFLFGGVLAASAARDPDERVNAPSNAWEPKSSDWPTFHHGNDRTGLTNSTATMKLAYYKWSVKTGGAVLSSPAVAAVDTNSGGVNNYYTKIFIGSNDYRLYCIDGRSGSVVWRYQAVSSIVSSPAVGDIDGDGNPEVVFGSDDGRVYALRGNNGTLLWRFTTRDAVSCPPALVDLNGDGRLETVIGSEDGRLYALKADGSLLWGTYLYSAMGVTAPVAAGDINGDGRPELVVRSQMDDTFAIDGPDGKVLWAYESPFNTHMLSSISAGPCIADLDGDGRLDVLSIDGPTEMSCFEGKDGTVKWQQIFSGDILTTPAVGDADGDGKPEIIFGLSDNSVICIDGQAGEVEWTRSFRGAQYSSPALADVDGDGRPEALFGGMDSIMHCLNAEDGSVRWAYPCPNIIWSSPAVADFDADGKAELTFGCVDGRIYALDYNF